MNYTILGLDGGATKIRGAVLECTSSHEFFCSSSIEEMVYRNCEGYNKEFQSVPILLQLEQFRGNQIVLTPEEKTQGEVFVNAALYVIDALYKKYPGKPCLIGIGMPGLKTNDGRGIGAMANGPRIPEYAKSLEEKLEKRGIPLFAPIANLGSDADYCGIGEVYSTQGQMRDGQNVYYLGIGTGVADAMKIQGQLLPFDKAKPWIAKSWEMLGKEGKTFEKKISMFAIEEAYKTVDPCAHAGHVFDLALQGEAKAKEILESVVSHIVHLLYDRIYTLAVGGTTTQFADAKRAALIPNHPYAGLSWEKIVLGQRIGNLWLKKEYKAIFQNQVCKSLEKSILSLPEKFHSLYVKEGNLLENLLVASPLDIAPVLGAGISAYLALENL